LEGEVKKDSDHLKALGVGENLIFQGILTFNSLNAKLNPICHLLALLGAHHILHISRIRVKNHASYI
jgi:hypothetical protein